MGKELETLGFSNKTLNKSASEKGTLLFFSYDLVGSTRYKKSNSSWKKDIFDIINDINKEIKNSKNELGESVFWKFLGDEVIYFYIVKNVQSLNNIICDIYNLLRKESNKIKKNFGLSLKATAWLSFVSDNNNEGENHYITKEDSGDIDFDFLRGNIEFVGPDIDTGFRISKFTKANQLTLSYELVRLLEGDDYELKFISFAKLKGVWDDNDYPIYWFFKRIDGFNEEKIDDTFEINDEDDNNLIKDYYFHNRYEFLNENKYVFNKLNELQNDMKKTEYINILKDNMGENLNKLSKEYVYE